MSIFLDQKYLTLISNQLPRFKRKNDNTFNCRCIICGDSTKKATKARGYFFPYKTNLMYKCYNCDASMYFATFLKRLFPSIYPEYAFEQYAEGNTKPTTSLLPIIKMEEPVFKSKEERLLDKLLDRLDQLPDDNEAVQFCIKRKIPKERFNSLYFIPNIKDIVQLNDKYKASIIGEEPRLVIPFYNEEGQLTGVTCRALRGEALRYITVKIKDDDNLFFGLDTVKKDNLVYVVEGPIDSLFLDNAVALSGVNISKVNFSTIPKERLVIVFDNQPRNSQLLKVIEKTINDNYNVVIWPQNLDEKDINDMILAGKNVKNIIKQNTFKGLEAKLKFTSWKRV